LGDGTVIIKTAPGHEQTAAAATQRNASRAAMAVLTQADEKRAQRA
jgi:hypothetical protein